MFLKGQSSVELTMVVSMALVISSPFIYASQSSVIELDDASRFLALDKSMEEIKSVSNELNSSSYPARRVVQFRTPRGVQKIYNPNISGGSAVIFEVDSKAGTINRSIFLDHKLDIRNPGNFSERGLHDLSLRKSEEKVNLSVID